MQRQKHRQQSLANIVNEAKECLNHANPAQHSKRAGFLTHFQRRFLLAEAEE